MAVLNATQDTHFSPPCSAWWWISSCNPSSGTSASSMTSSLRSTFVPSRSKRFASEQEARETGIAARVFEIARSGNRHWRSGRRSVRHCDLLDRGRATWSGSSLDCATDLAAHGLHSDDVRTHRDGDWARINGRVSPSNSKACAVDRRVRSVCCEFDQHRRGSRRHGGRGGNAYQNQFAHPCPTVRRRHRRRHDILSLPSNREYP